MSELVLVDTSSVAVPLAVAEHEHHEAFSERVAHCEVGLSGHAAFETFSVLTRLPAPLRRSPATVGRIIGSSFPKSVFLSPEGARSLLPVLARGSIAGGAIYDALVGAAAAEAGIRLLSGDRRAADTFAQRQCSPTGPGFSGLRLGPSATGTVETGRLVDHGQRLHGRYQPHCLHRSGRGGGDGRNSGRPTRPDR